jgi:hypothetical protein
MTAADHARTLDPIALLAAVDNGGGQPYRDELRQRLERLRQARLDGTLDVLIRDNAAKAR